MAGITHSIEDRGAGDAVFRELYLSPRLFHDHPVMVYADQRLRTYALERPGHSSLRPQLYQRGAQGSTMVAAGAEQSVPIRHAAQLASRFSAAGDDNVIC